MTVKNGKEQEIKFLWHGSKGTQTSLITDGDEGFDVRFAANGRHGYGTYFAVNASYSCDKRWVHTDNGHKAVFYAACLPGDCADHCDANRKMPPVNPNTGRRYDCVYEGGYNNPQPDQGKHPLVEDISYRLLENKLNNHTQEKQNGVMYVFYCN